MTASEIWQNIVNDLETIGQGQYGFYLQGDRMKNDSTPSKGWESAYCKHCQKDTDTTIDNKCALCDAVKPSKCKICGKIFTALRRNKGYYCSDECNYESLRRGRPHKPLSPEHKEKIGKALRLGKRKEVVSYTGFHKRVFKTRGKAYKCVHCETLDAKKYEWANISGRLDDVDDYMQLCTKCHRKYDNKMKEMTAKARQEVMMTELVHCEEAIERARQEARQEIAEWAKRYDKRNDGINKSDLIKKLEEEK